MYLILSPYFTAQSDPLFRLHIIVCFVDQDTTEESPPEKKPKVEEASKSVSAIEPPDVSSPLFLIPCLVSVK